MARRPVGNQPNPHGKLLGRRDRDVLYLTITGHRASTLRQTVLGLDLTPMVLDHVVDTESRRPLFPCLGQEDDVPVELDVGAFQQQHEHQRRRDVVLVVEGPPAVDVPISDNGCERIDGPVLALHAHDIGMRHDQNRLLATVATKPRDQVRAGRVEGEELGVYTLLLEDSLKVSRGFGLISGRIAGIDAQQRREVLHRFGLDGLPIHGITVLRVARERHGRQHGAECRRGQAVVPPELSNRSHRLALRVFYRPQLFASTAKEPSKRSE